jgi:hypothetical protein
VIAWSTKEGDVTKKKRDRERMVEGKDQVPGAREHVLVDEGDLGVEQLMDERAQSLPASKREQAPR